MILKMLQAGLITFAILLTGLAIPIQEANAHTVCHTYWKHGAKHRSCSSRHRHYRTICRTYWRHGVQHRSCYRKY